MAIFILTASKATPRKGVNYVLDKEKIELWRVWNLSPTADPAQQMIDTQRLWTKDMSAEMRKYYHLKMAFSPKDRKEEGGALTAEVALKFALDFCRREFPTAEGVISVQNHGKTRHIHIILNAVDPLTGKKLQFSDHYQRVLKRLVQYKMCKEYGLETMNWEEATAKKRIAEKNGATKYAKTAVEQRISNRKGYRWKDELREIIDTATQKADNREAFETLLAEQGVTLSRSTEKTISYVFGAHPAVRGNRLGDAYTAEAIDAALMPNRENVRDQRSGLDALIGDAEYKKGTQTTAAKRVAVPER